MSNTVVGYGTVRGHELIHVDEVSKDTGTEGLFPSRALCGGMRKRSRWSGYDMEKRTFIVPVDPRDLAPHETAAEALESAEQQARIWSVCPRCRTRVSALSRREGSDA